MSYSIDVAAARALATKAHEGQTDKAGLPYITHPERVASRMENPEAQVIGWLHDSVEDTHITLRQKGYARFHNLNMFVFVFHGCFLQILRLCRKRFSLLL